MTRQADGTGKVGRYDFRNLPEPIETYWEAGVDDWKSVEAAVQQLSDGFTTERERGFGNYTQEALSQTVYGLFHFPRSWAMVRSVLYDLLTFRRWAPQADTLSVLDLGAGTGAAGLALASGLREFFPEISIYLEA